MSGPGVDSPPPETPGIDPTYPLAQGAMSGPGVDSQPPEVKPHSVEGFRFPRHTVADHTLLMSSFGGLLEETLGSAQDIPEEPLPFSSYVDETHWVPDVNGHSGSTRETVPEAPTAQLLCQMKQAPSRSLSADQIGGLPRCGSLNC